MFEVRSSSGRLIRRVDSTEHAERLQTRGYVVTSPTPTTPKDVAEPSLEHREPSRPIVCQYRGGQLRTDECPSCSGRVSVKVFACDVHRECQLADKLAGVKSCIACTDQIASPPTPPVQIPAPTRQNQSRIRFVTTSEVTAIIPVHGQSELLARCLGSLAASTLRPNVLVIDNGSPIGDRSEIDRLVSQYGGTVIRFDKNRGFTAAINEGFRRTVGDIVVLNSDCFVGPNCLASLANVAREQDAVVTPIVTDNGAESIRCDNVRSWSGVAECPPLEDLTALENAVMASRTTPKPIGYAPFACAFIRREQLDRVGWLHRDTDYASGLFADTEWCRRAAALGIPSILDTNAVAIHLGSATFKSGAADYSAEFARGQVAFNREPYVVAGILLCDRKRYSQLTAVEAVAKMHGVREIIVNIETAAASSAEFENLYRPLLDFAKTSPVPIVFDRWSIHSDWMPSKPTHDQDQFYRLPRIVAARNQVCEFVWSHSKATHLLFVDSDVSPKPDGLDYLLPLRRPLCGGLGTGRGPWTNFKMVFGELSRVGNNSELIECQWGTCGYMLIEKQVLGVQRFRWGTSAGFETSGELRSEDPAFCEDAYLNGFGRFWIHAMASASHHDDPTSPLQRHDRPEF